jgi:hypothetical protein
MIYLLSDLDQNAEFARKPRRDRGRKRKPSLKRSVVRGALIGIGGVAAAGAVAGGLYGAAYGAKGAPASLKRRSISGVAGGLQGAAGGTASAFRPSLAAGAVGAVGGAGVYGVNKLRSRKKKRRR